VSIQSFHWSFTNHLSLTVLTVNTLKAVKPEKARMVEDILINNARMGRLQGRLSEADLKDILERVNEQTKKETKVTITRRAFDDDDEDFN
jgi:programmed cell death protein 5